MNSHLVKKTAQAVIYKAEDKEFTEKELDNVKGGIPYEDAKDKILKDINDSKSSLEDNDERED